MGDDGGEADDSTCDDNDGGGDDSNIGDGGVSSDDDGHGKDGTNGEYSVCDWNVIVVVSNIIFVWLFASSGWCGNRWWQKYRLITCFQFIKRD